LYRFTLTVPISAPPSRVWRALCDPNEVVLWDGNVTAAIDAPSDYPQSGQDVRWRYGPNSHHMLRDRPQEVVPNRRLRSRLDLGRYRMDETYELTPEEWGCWLELHVTLTVAPPLIGLLLERLYAGRAVRRDFLASLRALRSHCETTP
jgi:uncharacterized protein YndB with AHSA1/START domain